MGTARTLFYRDASGVQTTALVGEEDGGYNVCAHFHSTRGTIDVWPKPNLSRIRPVHVYQASYLLAVAQLGIAVMTLAAAQLGMIGDVKPELNRFFVQFEGPAEKFLWIGDLIKQRLLQSFKG